MESALPEQPRRANAIGDRAFACEADVTDHATMGKAFDSVRQRFGRIDAVVSNTGISISTWLTTH